MHRPGPGAPTPVPTPIPTSADDLDQAVQLALRVLRGAPEDGWDALAGTLRWTCWETVEHINDDLFAYAVQLGLRVPRLDDYLPFAESGRRPGGPTNSVHVDREAGPTGLLQTLEACGALLVAMVRTTSPEVRAYHPYGISDPAGFAAMGVVETLVHTHDLAQGLGLTWEPPAELCARTLDRLFPHAPTSTPPWPTLRWATGRGELPGLPRLTSWRWNGVPRPAGPDDSVAPELPGDFPIRERDAVRLVVRDSADRILLFHTHEVTVPEQGQWWELPGGGLDEGETQVQAALRELREETGITVTEDQLGSPTWRRTASFRHREFRNLQHEVVVEVRLDGPGPDVDESQRLDYEKEDYFAFRWWPLAEVIGSAETFYPGRLPRLLAPFLAGEEIDEPFELFS